MEPKLLTAAELDLWLSHVTDDATQVALSLHITALETELDDERLRSDVYDGNYRKALAKSKERKKALEQLIEYMEDNRCLSCGSKFPPGTCGPDCLLRSALADEPSPCTHEWVADAVPSEVKGYWITDGGGLVKARNTSCRHCGIAADTVDVNDGNV